MLRLHLAKLLHILALSFLLGLPGVAAAEHFHDTVHEEEFCDVCEITGPASTERTNCAPSVPKPHEIQDKKVFIPLETYLFHKHQRGPPLLR